VDLKARLKLSAAEGVREAVLADQGFANRLTVDHGARPRIWRGGECSRRMDPSVNGSLGHLSFRPVNECKRRAPSIKWFEKHLVEQRSHSPPARVAHGARAASSCWRATYAFCCARVRELKALIAGNKTARQLRHSVPCTQIVLPFAQSCLHPYASFNELENPDKPRGPASTNARIASEK
jgi:hypothetical protein